jgi:hypothetical protein
LKVTLDSRVSVEIRASKVPSALQATTLLTVLMVPTARRVTVGPKAAEAQRETRSWLRTDLLAPTASTALREEWAPVELRANKATKD